jgi:ABC-type multidrug transport system fused ATPase/permease subunit
VIVHTIYSTITSGTEVGTLTIIIAAARTFQGNLESIVSLIAEQWNSAKGVILIEEEFFGTKSSLITPFPVVPRFDITPTISFRDVCFTYPDSQKPVLNDVSFTIRPGTKTAIIGESGNGKSTLMALLLRQYDPSSGVIDVEGVHLKNIDPKDWSNIVSGLTQDYTILERRIGEEIASSRLDKDADPNLIMESAKFACFDGVISADQKGIDAQIGTEHGGREFSGGEKQRLALARVYYRGTPVLVLDEPDAKLDPVSANKVMENIFALKGVTVIIITHHVSRSERCDHVIVMSKGRVIEQGSPLELKEKGGHFVAMIQSDRKRQGKDKSPESDTAGSE